MKTNVLLSKYLHIILLWIFLFPSASAQNNLKLYNSVSLSSDRSVYLSGEDIFFSAFVNNFYEADKNLNTILYVEVYNQREAIVQKKFKINDNIVLGTLSLPEDCYSGNYFLRAYTKFDRNLPVERMHHQLISVINPGEAFPKEDQVDLPPAEIICKEDNNETHYFIRINSRPELTGIVLENDSGAEVRKLPANASGLHKISLPKNDTLGISTFVLAQRNNKPAAYPLSTAASKPVSVTYEEFENKIQFQVNTESALIAQHGSDLKMLIKNENYQTIGDRLFNTNTTDGIDFDKKLFESGGLYYLIFQNFNSKTIYVTSIYIGDNKNRSSIFQLNTVEYPKRASVTLSLQQDLDFEKAEIKVIESRLNKEYQDFIPPHIGRSHVLMRSYLETKRPTNTNDINQINSALIFQEDEFNRPEFIRNLFFSLPENPEFVPDIRDVSIAGKATFAESGEPAGDIDIFASVAYGKNQLHHTRSSADGQFIFSLSNACNIQNVFITAGQQSKDIKISIVNDFHPSKPFMPKLPLMADTTDKELFTRLYVHKQIKRIFEGKVQSDTVGFCPGIINFEGLENYSVQLADYIQLPTTTEIFHELVPYSEIKTHNNRSTLRIYNEKLKRYEENPLILLDFMPVFDVDEILKINPAKITQIDIINQTFIIGNFHFDAILIMHTNTKDFAGINLPENAVYLKYAGVQHRSQPLFPNYATQTDHAKREADFRDLLFLKNYTGTLPESVQFYTSDAEGTYDVIFTGIRADGTLVSQREKIDVK